MNEIPRNNLIRIVILGGGFAGLKLARTIDNNKFQVVLIDKNNHHQFQPLFYQVATAGLEPSAISFPFRKIFQQYPNFYFRLATAIEINEQEQLLITDIGTINYDFLVIAIGANTNYFGNQTLASTTLPMKTTAEALYIRNTIIQNFEHAVNTTDIITRQAYIDIVVVGGGPTGVEVSGALAEMKTHILPKDYPEIDFKKMTIYLIDGSNRLLNAMSPISSEKAYEYLNKLGVNIILNDVVADYQNDQVQLKSGKTIISKNVIWAAGIQTNKINGLNESYYSKNRRIFVDGQNKIIGSNNIYALGDIACMCNEEYPNGHAQLAGVAQQQALLLAENFNKNQNRTFIYNDRGSMATIGKNLAVVEFPFMKLQGMIAWFIWMFIHLMLILGVKNRLFIFINWAWSYITFDQSLRLLIKPIIREENK